MIISSIRGRIQIWHTALLVLITGGLSTAFYYHEKEIRIRILDNELTAQITPILPLFVPIPGIGLPVENERLEEPPSSRRPQGERRQRPGRERREAMTQELKDKGFYVVVIHPDGRELVRTELCPENFALPKITQRPIPQTPYTRGQYREVIHSPRNEFIVIVGTSLKRIHTELQTLRWQLTAVAASVCLFGFVVGWYLIGRSLRPIQSISTTAEHISEGQLSQRIDPGKTDDELGQLVGVLNGMFDKLEVAFEQQVRFTADASHELRTPIAVILAKCQFALMRERSPEKYREALKACQDSAKHIGGLVQSLLELAKVDSGEFKVLPEPGDLANLAGQCAGLLRPLAEEKQIRLTVEANPAQCHFDHERMKQVAINLLSNAIKYTPEGGKVSLTTTADDGYGRLTVSDTGIGIREEALPHIFDRFYRSDEGRSDEQKSTGLGLAITQAIVLAHGGTVVAEANPAGGTRFIVTLPASARLISLDP